MAKTLAYGDDARFIEWASEITGARYFPDARAIGVVDGDRIRGAAIFDVFSLSSCNIHFVSDGSKRWLTREALIAFFAYPFIQCKLRRVTGYIALKNAEAQKMAVDLGATYEGLLRYGLPDDDLVIYGITRDRCVFIPPEFRSV